MDHYEKIACSSLLGFRAKGLRLGVSGFCLTRGLIKITPGVTQKYQATGAEVLSMGPLTWAPDPFFLGLMGFYTVYNEGNGPTVPISEFRI